MWVTKYCYHVLKGEVQMRCEELIMQMCNAEDVRILKGVVIKNLVHMYVPYPPSSSVSNLSGQPYETRQGEDITVVALLSSCTWGSATEASPSETVGYGAWSTENITEEMVQQYLEHHRRLSS